MSQIAVVITCYNLGRTLEQALDSVLAQARPPTEVVVVDDGSTDLFTQQLLPRIDSSTIRVVRTANKGVSAARNLGIKLTTAPYLLLLDADDWLDPTYFEKAGARLDAEQGLAFVSCAQRAFGALDYVWKPHAADLIDHVSRGPLHISTMFRRTLWEAVGGFQEGLPADEEMDFWTSALALGFRGEVLDEPLLNYRVRAESMYHRLLQRETYVALRENFYEKHLKSLEPHFQELLLAKEALILEQRSHAKHLAATKVALEQEVASLRAAAKELAKSLANQNIPVIDWGDFGDREPISAYWGVDRGEPINRYYIIKFLQRHKSDICGHVLEVKDSFYTRSFGGDKVTQADVLDINPLNPVATVVADLTKADKIPSNRFDCFILTQTLNFIYDVQAALSHAMRILRPGGVLLASVSALDRISYETGPDGDYWRFTEASLRTLLAQHLPLDAFEISGFGNVAACAAYLYGLSSQEVDPKTLEVTDPWFPIGFCIRAVKPPQRDSKKRDTPLVSIVTAFYNAESFLAEAIESVLAQSYDNWELLLVDDGSKDGSTRIARQYANQHPEKIFYLEHHNHDNRGAAASRNYAIRCSKGQYVAILDADDVWFPHKLERQVVILGSEPRAAMVCGRSLYWYGWTEKPEDLQRDNAPDLGVQENRLYEPPELLKSFYPLGNGGAPCPSNILLRRNMMEKEGGFQEEFRGDYQLYEDQVFLTKLYLQHPVFVSMELWDKYRIHPQSCVATVTRAGKYDAVRHYFLRWLEKHLSELAITDGDVWSMLQNSISACRQSKQEINGTESCAGAGTLCSASVLPDDGERELTLMGATEHQMVANHRSSSGTEDRGVAIRKVLVLCYHRIAKEVCDPWSLCVTPKHFDEQLTVLNSYAQVIRLDELASFLADGNGSERAVAITFDDGYADTFHTARPLLDRHQSSATLFVVGDYVGRETEFWWDELDRLLLQPGRLPASLELRIGGGVICALLGESKNYSTEDYEINRNWRAWDNPPTPRHALYYSIWKEMRPMPSGQQQQCLEMLRNWAKADPQARKSHQTLSVAELRVISEDRLIEIGCHTQSHSQLSSLPLAMQMQEVGVSKRHLEKLLGYRMASFAYPYGGKEDYNADTIYAVQQADFDRACSTVPGLVTSDSDVFQLSRVLAENWSGEAMERQLWNWFGEGS